MLRRSNSSSRETCHPKFGNNCRRIKSLNSYNVCFRCWELRACKSVFHPCACRCKTIRLSGRNKFYDACKATLWSSPWRLGPISSFWPAIQIWQTPFILNIHLAFVALRRHRSQSDWLLGGCCRFIDDVNSFRSKEINWLRWCCLSMGSSYFDFWHQHLL